MIDPSIERHRQPHSDILTNTHTHERGRERERSRDARESSGTGSVQWKTLATASSGLMCRLSDTCAMDGMGAV